MPERRPCPSCSYLNTARAEICAACGKPLDETSAPVPINLTHGMAAAVFSPDGERLATAEVRTHRVCLWDVRTGAPAGLASDLLYPSSQLAGPPTSPVAGNMSFAQGCGAGHRWDWPDAGDYCRLGLIEVRGPRRSGLRARFQRQA